MKFKFPQNCFQIFRINLNHSQITFIFFKSTPNHLQNNPNQSQINPKITSKSTPNHSQLSCLIVGCMRECLVDFGLVVGCVRDCLVRLCLIVCCFYCLVVFLLMVFGIILHLLCAPYYSHIKSNYPKVGPSETSNHFKSIPNHFQITTNQSHPNSFPTHIKLSPNLSQTTCESLQITTKSPSNHPQDSCICCEIVWGGNF